MSVLRVGRTFSQTISQPLYIHKAAPMSRPIHIQTESLYVYNGCARFFHTVSFSLILSFFFGRRPCRKSTAQTIHWSAQVKGNKITISHDKFIIVSGRANAAAAAAAALLRLLLDP
jgi:hypothetical protein